MSDAEQREPTRTNDELERTDGDRSADNSADSGDSASAADFNVDEFPGGLRSCLEAVLMVAEQPQHTPDLAHALHADENRVRAALRGLQHEYDGEGDSDGGDDGAGGDGDVHDVGGAASRPPRGFALRHSARGWQLVSRSDFEPVVAAFVTDGQTARLSQAAFEVLAIIAYRQPITRAQVAAIRGVNSDGVIRSLLIRGLLRTDGVDADTHAERLGTTELFLEKMGIESLDDLPSLAPFMPSEQTAINDVLGRGDI